MGLIEEVQNLKSSGMSDNETADILEKRGYTEKDVSNAIAQSRIRDAVSSDSDTSSQSQDMQPSMLDSKPSNQVQETYQQDYYQPQQQYQQQDYTQYSSTSTDAISEIAEQVASEKLSSVKEQIEKVVDMKTNFESKLTYVEERLKRIEKIIDNLQMSIIKKVGDYGEAIEDLRNELIQTQKTFKAVTGKEK